MRRGLHLAATFAVAVFVGTACTSRSADAELRAVLEGQRRLAEAMVGDALSGALHLQEAIAVLARAPSAQTLDAARAAWRAARPAYAQAEALRFGHWFMDEADGRLNSWPVDEGFLDYVDGAYLASASNAQAQLNLIAAPDDLPLAGQRLRTEPMQRVTLKTAQGLSDHEANIATGYHAIEFLLWGQDLDARGPGARPWTDYAREPAACTDGPRAAPLRHCQRRAAALEAMAAILRQDLELLRAQWSATPGSFGDRFARGDARLGLQSVLFGLSTFSSQELAGERLRAGLISGGQEEEQDCFSDDTHRSIFNNAQGVAALYAGRYGALQVASVQAYAERYAPEQAARLRASLSASQSALAALHAAGEGGETFDRLIAPEQAGNALVEQAAAALDAQAIAFEALAQALVPGVFNPQAARP